MLSHPFPPGGRPPYSPVTFAEDEDDESVFLGNRERSASLSLPAFLVQILIDSILILALNYWRYHPSSGFDLTRNAPLSDTFTINSTTGPVKLCKSTTAIVVIDFQNFFVHPAIRDHPRAVKACEVLKVSVLPAAHEAGVQGESKTFPVDSPANRGKSDGEGVIVIAVIYTNWGLTPMDLQHMPPHLIRSFSRDVLSKPDKVTPPSASATKAVYKGMGRPMGVVTVSKKDPSKKGEGEDVMEVDAGALLCRDQWNSQLYTPLQEDYIKFREVGSTMRPDHYVNKNRLSGMW